MTIKTCREVKELC